MAQVQSRGRRTAPSVEVERLLLLVKIKNQIQLAVAEEDASANEPVTFLPRQLLNLVDLLLQNLVATKFLNELIVVDAGILYSLDLNTSHPILTILTTVAACCLLLHRLRLLHLVRPEVRPAVGANSKQLLFALHF